MNIVDHYQRFLAETGSEVAAAIFALDAVNCEERGKSHARPEYLTVKEAALKYNLGERTIYRMVEDGLPVVRAGKAIRIKPRDLEKRLEDSETILC